MLKVEQLYLWSDWYPLQNCWLEAPIPQLPGLYRIRRMGRNDLDYIGQTGNGSMNLRKRLAMLKGVYADEMPYRDPHTAAPALWALRHSTDCSFEVSIVPVTDSTPMRKGLESLAISLYRQQVQRSPTVNFGRIPSGYQISSSNNAQLVAAGKRVRGGVSDQHTVNHLPGISPAGTLTGDLYSSTWGGHQWSRWLPLSESMEALPSEALGLYRIRGSNSENLVYIGQGVIRDRLLNHFKKAISPTNPQGQIFANSGSLECSWVCNDFWYIHQRLELENDLIAAHVLFAEIPPSAQFLG